MSDAREKAVHKLAAVLTAFAASHVPDNAKRFVDAVIRSGPADPALVGALRATFRALGLVIVPPELVTDWRDARDLLWTRDACKKLRADLDAARAELAAGQLSLYEAQAEVANTWALIGLLREQVRGLRARLSPDIPCPPDAATR